MHDNEPGFQSPKYSGPWVNATHPGAVATDQLQQAVEAYGTVAKVGIKAIKPMMKEPVDEGCRPALFAATSEDIVKGGIQGQYVSRPPSAHTPQNAVSCCFYFLSLPNRADGLTLPNSQRLYRIPR